MGAVWAGWYLSLHCMRVTMYSRVGIGKHCFIIIGRKRLCLPLLFAVDFDNSNGRCGDMRTQIDPVCGITNVSNPPYTLIKVKYFLPFCLPHDSRLLHIILQALDSFTIPSYRYRRYQKVPMFFLPLELQKEVLSFWLLCISTFSPLYLDTSTHLQVYTCPFCEQGCMCIKKWCVCGNSVVCFSLSWPPFSFPSPFFVIITSSFRPHNNVTSTTSLLLTISINIQGARFPQLNRGFLATHTADSRRVTLAQQRYSRPCAVSLPGLNSTIFLVRFN